MDDREIIELYNKRDEQAIVQTANKYGKYCFTIAHNILSDKQDCEECVNDTWLRTWNSIPPVQPNCLGLFLARITRNLSLNRLKELNRQKRGNGELATVFDEIGEFISDRTRVETELEEREFMNCIKEFLHSLPERERGVFVRRYFHADATQIIARSFSVTEGNVLKILSRTRQKLKVYLLKKGYEI